MQCDVVTDDLLVPRRTGDHRADWWISTAGADFLTAVNLDRLNLPQAIDADTPRRGARRMGCKLHHVRPAGPRGECGRKGPRGRTLASRRTARQPCGMNDPLESRPTGPTHFSVDGNQPAIVTPPLPRGVGDCYAKPCECRACIMLNSFSRHVRRRIPEGRGPSWGLRSRLRERRSRDAMMPRCSPASYRELPGRFWKREAPKSHDVRILIRLMRQGALLRPG
jgi:hypothetical protein